MLKLLIELLAQACEFIWIAEIFRVDLLVERTRVGTVMAFLIAVSPVAPRLWPGRLFVALRVGGGFLVGLAGLVGRTFALHFLGAGRQHLVGVGLLRAFAFGGVVLRAGLLALLFLLILAWLLLQVCFGFGEIHRGQQPARSVGVGGLVGLGSRQFVEGQIGVLAEIVAPLLEDRLCGARRRLTAHALAGQ